MEYLAFPLAGNGRAYDKVRKIPIKLPDGVLQLCMPPEISIQGDTRYHSISADFPVEIALQVGKTEILGRTQDIHAD